MNYQIHKFVKNYENSNSLKIKNPKTGRYIFKHGKTCKKTYKEALLIVDNRRNKNIHNFTTEEKTFLKNKDVELNDMVIKMRNKNKIQKTEILKKIQSAKNLTEKCILSRNFLSPQSTDFEKIIKKDLLIDTIPLGKQGDGIKNNLIYEIKTSIHSKTSKLNFVQIRPDNKIDYYLLIGYDIYHNILGKSYIFKIPSEDFYKIVIKFGSIIKLGKFCEKNFKGKNKMILNELIKYKIQYDHKNI